MNLILAQGAEHTNQDRLKRIVETVVNQRNMMPDHYFSDKHTGYIHDKYGVSRECVYANVDYVTETKMDGFSYLNSGGRFYSKRLSTAKGNEGNPVDKTGHMPHLTSIMREIYETIGADLHGEIYVPGGISDDVSSFLGCTEDECARRINDSMEQKGLDSVLHYMLIDIRQFENQPVINEPYWVRRALLEYVYDRFIRYTNAASFVHLSAIVYDDPRAHFRNVVMNGGEGIIFKRTGALYIPGKKPADNWIKGKKKITHDVVIMGYNDGTGKNKSMFGSIRFGHYVNGKLTECGNCSSGLNDTTRAKIAADPDIYIGHVMEIEAIQESAKSFRNAVFLRLRDDKAPEECIPINIRIKTELI